jgi:peptidoglycan hydrolase CwlO-like protein
MSNSNYPTATTEVDEPRKNYKNLIIGILSVALVVLAVFFIVDKNNTGVTIQHQQTQLATVTDQKSEIQKSFDASLARLDSMSTLNTNLQAKLSDGNKEIAKTKAEIRSILNKKNATAAELGRAKKLIASLNDKISGMEQQIAQLTQDNQTLTQDKATLTQEKEQLNQNLTATTATKDSLVQKVDVASTLNASNIAITPVNVKNSGKEKVTTTAKRVDKLVISFDVNNRIAQPGMTDVFVCVIGPDGKPISTQALNSGTFTTREEGDKAFTAKLPVDIETAKKKNVQFSFTPGNNFQQGNYTIEIYQNGFLIGEGTRELKKGGLFS